MGRRVSCHRSPQGSFQSVHASSTNGSSRTRGPVFVQSSTVGFFSNLMKKTYTLARCDDVSADGKVCYACHHEFTNAFQELGTPERHPYALIDRSSSRFPTWKRTPTAGSRWTGQTRLKRLINRRRTRDVQSCSAPHDRTIPRCAPERLKRYERHTTGFETENEGIRASRYPHVFQVAEERHGLRRCWASRSCALARRLGRIIAKHRADDPSRVHFQD
jgi:hypothetical protein